MTRLATMGLPVLLDMSIELLCKFVGIMALPDPQSQVDEAEVGRRLVKEGWLSGKKEGEVIEVGKVAKVTYPLGKAEVLEPSRTPPAPLGPLSTFTVPLPSKVKEPKVGQRVVKHGIVSRDTTGTIIGTGKVEATYPPNQSQ